MPSRLHQFREKLYARLPTAQVLWVPAHVFVTHFLERPADTAEADLRAFIELSLEGLSPFPVDQLYWGFVSEPGASRILVYTTPRQRLATLGLDKLDSFYHVLPSFLSYWGETFETPTVRFVYENGSLSALVYAAHDPIPERILSRPVEGELLTHEAILATRAQLLSRLPTEGYVVEPGVWTDEGTELLDNRRLGVHLRHLRPDDTSGEETAAGLHFLPDNPRWLWSADLRDGSFARRSEKQRRLGTVSWYAFRAAGAAAVLLLLAQLVVWGLHFWNLQLKQELAAVRGPVQAIADMRNQADRLQASTQRDLQPFRMLQLINEIRPDAVYFERTESRTFNQLSIEGQSQAVSPINEYTQSLNNLPYIARAELQRLGSDQGASEFTLLIEFSEIPAPPAPEPEPEAAPPAEEDAVAQTEGDN